MHTKYRRKKHRRNTLYCCILETEFGFRYFSYRDVLPRNVVSFWVNFHKG